MTEIDRRTRLGIVVAGLTLAAAATTPGCKGKPAPRGEQTPGRGAGPPPPTNLPAPSPSAFSPAMAELASILPSEAGGYRPEGADGYYDSKTLFELINGGAEVFLALNVNAVVSRRYVKPKAPEIIVDVFDMGSASDAYGAYHHDIREGKSVGFGHESELGGSSMFFWKGRFYVSVVAFANTDASHDAVIVVGKAVADRIEDSGEPPTIVGHLPKDGLVTSQVYYFHTWELLNRHYQLGNTDPFALNKDTEGVLARYRRGEAEHVVLLLRFPSPARAKKGLERFVGALAKGEPGEVFRGGKGWMGAKQQDNLLFCVLEAGSSEEASSLLTAIAQQRKEAP